MILWHLDKKYSKKWGFGWKLKFKGGKRGEIKVKGGEIVRD